MTLVTPYYFLLFPLRELTRTQKNFINLWVFPFLFSYFPIIFPIIFPLYPHNFTVSYIFLINSKYSHKKKREEKRGRAAEKKGDKKGGCERMWEIALLRMSEVTL